MVSQPVAIAVVTWNSADVIEPCLRAAAAQDPSEIVIVDNGSRDATLGRARQVYPGATVVAWRDNRGFAAGCNAGVAASRAPYILFLNDDAVLASDYAARLLARLEAEPRAASAVGKLVNGDRIDSAGIRMSWWALRPDDRGHGEPDRGQYDAATEIFGPSGAAALYRREALLAAGPEAFDPDLFAYYEDVDLAWRLRRRGWRHLYVPDAVATHTRRGPGRKPADIEARAFVNRYLVWLKNESLMRFAAYAPVALPWEAARLVRLAWSKPHVATRIPRDLAGRIARAWAKRGG